jgi:hypothetical protein
MSPIASLYGLPLLSDSKRLNRQLKIMPFKLEDQLTPKYSISRLNNEANFIIKAPRALASMDLHSEPS